MNKKIIVVMLVNFTLLLSCTKSKELTSTLHKVFINQTSKKVIQVIVTDVGRDSITSYGMDSSSVKFVRRTMSEEGLFGLGNSRAPMVEVNNEIIFNLTDTSKFHYLVAYSNYTNQGSGKEDSIYANHLSFVLDNLSTDANPIIFAKFYFSDSIVQIMEKDYSMLIRFKGFYNK